MSEAPWHYLWSHPERLELVATTPAFLWLGLLLPWVWWLGRRRAQPVAWIVLRCLACGAAIGAAAGLALQAAVPRDGVTLVVAQDVSASIESPGRAWQEETIADLRRRLSPYDRLAVVAFAGRAVVRHAPAAPMLEPGAVELAAADLGATDIETGLDAALDLITPERAGQVVLLSDGNETVGDAARALARARWRQVPIHVGVPPRQTGLDTAVAKLVVPPLVGAGSVFPLHVSVRHRGVATKGSFELRIDGRVIGSEVIELHPGFNGIAVPYRFDEPGLYRVEARVHVDGDVRPANDVRQTTLSVAGQVRILLVTNQPRSALRRVLEAKGIAVEAVAPQAFAGTDLSTYHAILLDELNGDALSPAEQRRLEAYVYELGGGLIVAGGEATFGAAALLGSPLARLLPVTIEPRRPPRAERQPLSLILLIDRSNSMAYHVVRRSERSPTESKLVFAQQAAMAVLEQLRPEDRLGIIAFDSLSHELAPLAAVAGQRARLERAIARLEPSGGTDFFAGLQRAADQLALAPSGARHVILLTDGDTNRPPEGHAALLESLAARGITVTAIRIGDDQANLELLHEIATRTGGDFHHVENATALPELMLRDASAAMARLAQDGASYVPTVVGDGQVVRGLGTDPVPPLYGYAVAKQRPGADVLLAIASDGRADPLLAVWQYGSGRVAALTASPRLDAELWVGWTDFGKLWSQLVRWSARAQVRGEHVLQVHRRGGQSELEIGTASDADEVLRVRLRPEPERVVEAIAVRQGPRRFRVALPDVPPGVYPLTLTMRSGSAVGERVELVRIPAADDEEEGETRPVGPNRGLLERLATASGGSIDSLSTALPERPLGRQRVRRGLDVVLIPLAIGALLLEVARRRRSAAGVW